MGKLSRLFTNGCSFLTHRHTDEIDLYLSTAELVKEHGEFQHMDNFARGGRGNDRIVATTITYFEMFPERKKDTFVMIGWSSALRMDYPTRNNFKPMPPLDETWATIKMAQATSVYAFDKASASKQPINYECWEVQRWYQNTLCLQNYLKVNNMKYVMYNSLEPALKVSTKKKQDHYMLRKAVDQDKFFRLDFSQYQHCQSIGQFISDNDHHPNEIGHRSWAKELTNFIEENKLYEI
tara:strand:- start:456 stop:1166 length:711 start_codon:yes stop_codon:yes gene_type:complete